ncbi:hypothetical protein ACJJTC_003582 [Scirpophaga incertulas]
MSEESQNETAQDSTLLEMEGATDPGAHPDSINTQTTGQMTSTTPASEGKWSCELCTYENFPLSKKCTMCRTAKPSLSENIFSLQDGASALPTHTVCDVELEVDAVAERLRPLRISSPTATHKWPCAVCTYENWPKSQKCAMCGAAAAPHSLISPSNNPTVARQPGHTVSAITGESDAAVAVAAAESEAEAGAGAGAGAVAEADAAWLAACCGVVDGDRARVLHYLRLGGDPARALQPRDVRALDRASAFDVGHTLVHLAIRFQRQDILTMLLSRISGGGPGLKRSPSYAAPDLATAIRRHIASCVRQNKGGLGIRYLSEVATFCLPAEIEELPGEVQERLFDELLDREAQQTLEADPPLINWSQELTGHEGSRLYALWNRSAGDCLLDSVSQAAYGVSDRGGVLRAALAASLRGAGRAFHGRWALTERAYGAGDSALAADWARALRAAHRPRHALLQLHVFVLAHVLRRPIFVYGVDLVNSFRGEPLGYARFQGIYLPLLWEEEEFCSKWPLCLGYTRGHFCALVPLACPQPYICREQEESEDVNYLPLTDCEGKLLPVHFLTCDEMLDAEGVVRRWVDADVVGGVLAARRPASAAPPHAALHQRRMLRAWLDRYRQQARGPYPPRLATGFPTDAASDDD